MIIPLATLAVLLLPLLLGGKPARLAAVELRYVGLIVAALAVQILIVQLLTGPETLLRAAHIATYVAAGWFMIANRRIPGLWLVGLGAVLNGMTITLNGGTLPARLGALRSAGIDTRADGFVNTGVLAHPHLGFLGDIFAVPAPLPLANVFSIGDILIVLGAGIVAWRVLGTRWTTPWTPEPEAAPPVPQAAPV